MSKKTKTSRELLFSVGSADVEWQTFRAGGKGGQYQNKTESGVRCIHHPSGARGEARDGRHQKENRRNAFVRMCETKEFKFWCRIEASKRMGHLSLPALVERAMAPENIKVEVRTAEGWVEVE